MSFQLQFHPLGDLCNRLVCGHKDTGNLCLDLQQHAVHNCEHADLTFK